MTSKAEVGLGGGWVAWVLAVAMVEMRNGVGEARARSTKTRRVEVCEVCEVCGCVAVGALRCSRECKRVHELVGKGRRSERDRPRSASSSSSPPLALDTP